MSSIKTTNLSIKFRIYHDKSASLKSYFSEIFQKRKNSAYTEFLAVNNISIQINSGDRIGIVGRNGAGKSTLLKALCRVYSPSSGKVIINGKIAPLLEIGAGFHPEFTGRENIYLNGSILGYKKSEINLIESEVIKFAELEEFIDTPVKYYSTGMYMRLAFSLATAMRPDILVLDEIFAGGDAKFMLKAKNRMHKLINDATIMIMVSHDHELIKSLCNRVIWIDHGKVVGDGEPKDIVDKYILGN